MSDTALFNEIVSFNDTPVGDRTALSDLVDFGDSAALTQTSITSGSTSKSDSRTTTDASFLGTGWAFPPSFDKSTHQVTLSNSDTNINQSLDLILQTPRGSRSLIPDFGGELSRFLFRSADATLQEEIEQSVKTTLLTNEPRITVDAVIVSFVRDPASTVAVSIQYTIKNTNTRHNHVFPFSLLEGTNLKVNT